MINEHYINLKGYLDGCHRESDLALSIDVRIHDTKNVLKLLRQYERL